MNEWPRGRVRGPEGMKIGMSRAGGDLLWLSDAAKQSRFCGFVVGRTNGTGDTARTARDASATAKIYSK